MAGNAEDPQVADVAGATLGERNQVVTLPVTWLEDYRAELAATMDAFKAVASVPGVLRIFVFTPVGVAGVADFLIHLRRVERAVVGLRWLTADQARARVS